MNKTPRILIVDDEPLNIDFLEQELEDFGYETVSAENGKVALEQVASQNPDMILLDIMMPIMDGFEVLEALQADSKWRDIPVVIVSAMNDMDSVVRGIELGADDYLSKPFNPTLLEARLNAGLEKKRLRDQEVEYLAQVDRLTAAASAVESDSFDVDALQPVAERDDALGTLAQVFQRMAQEVHAREQRLRLQIKQLELDIQEQAHGAAETAAVYLPMDRRQALASGTELNEIVSGTALFADITGFTPFSAQAEAELGKQRGTEEVARYLKQVFTALIEQLHAFKGSVIGFSGDAITCWFEGESQLQAVACGLAIQQAMGSFENMLSQAGNPVSIKLKVAIAAGTARRLLVGQSGIQKFEILAGGPIARLAAIEKSAQSGDVLIEARMVTDEMVVADWRGNDQSIAAISGLANPVPTVPWPELPPVPDQTAKPWLLSPTFKAIQNGTSQFTPELRPANALFLQFFGLDYDHDDTVGKKLDTFLCWVQKIVDHYGGCVLQVTTGEKGSFIYASFGAIQAHEDDAVRATTAALDLLTPPNMPFIQQIKIGLTGGEFYTGAYGSPARRTFGALGDRANMAARLMVAASEGILCDTAVYESAKESIHFDPHPDIQVKGKSNPISVYRPTSVKQKNIDHSVIDGLPPVQQMTLKVASVIGTSFTLEELCAIFPAASSENAPLKASITESLDSLQATGLISQSDTRYTFTTPVAHKTVYDLMLFAQKRPLHRSLASWYETHENQTFASDYANLAHHWLQAEDHTKAAFYFEKAGEAARQAGETERARLFLNQALSLT